MMAHDIAAITGFFMVTVFLGLNIVLACDRKGDLGIFESVGLSYLLGVAAVSIELFAFGLAGIKPSVYSIIIPWMALVLLNLKTWKAFVIKLTKLNIRVNKLSLFEKTIALFLAFIIFYTFLRALIKPMESYDSVAIWGFKAKVLYLSDISLKDFFILLRDRFQDSNADYPLLVPFSEVWFYIFTGKFNDMLVKALFPLGFTAFLAVFYSFLKRAVSDRKLALVSTFILASIRQFNNYATNGYADMPMAIYCSLTFLALYLWMVKGNGMYFWIAFLSCLSAMWTKNEGAIVLVTMIIVLLLNLKVFMKERVLSSILKVSAILLAVALFFAWDHFKYTIGLKNVIVSASVFMGYGIAEILKRAAYILYEYQRQFFGIKYWNLIWVAFLFFIFSGFKRIFSTEDRHVVIPIAVILLGYSAIYMITPLNYRWVLSASASRIFLHFLPLVVFYAALEVKRVFES